jgi:3-hydroxyisobutyrate dehydrogenase-like beta-hydroxyacid dehydrogenase
MKVGLIGLGQMGEPIGHNILAARHELTIYNRTVEKCRALEAAGAKQALTPLDAAGGDILITMVTDDKALEEIMFSKGLMAGMPETTIHVSCSTISIECAKRLRDAHLAQSRPFVSAPVVGRPDRAKEGLLFLLTSGDPSALELCRPVFESFSQREYNLNNDPVSAVAAKIANNFLVGCVIESLAEAYSIVDGNGIDRQAFHSFLTETVFSAPIYEVYGGLMVENTYLPPACPPAIGQKDMKLALQAGKISGHDLPIARIVEQHLQSAVENGFGAHDWSVLGSKAVAWKTD